MIDLRGATECQVWNSTFICHLTLLWSNLTTIYGFILTGIDNGGTYLTVFDISILVPSMRSHWLRNFQSPTASLWSKTSSCHLVWSTWGYTIDYKVWHSTFFGHLIPLWSDRAKIDGFILTAIDNGVTYFAVLKFSISVLQWVLINDRVREF